MTDGQVTCPKKPNKPPQLLRRLMLAAWSSGSKSPNSSCPESCDLPLRKPCAVNWSQVLTGSFMNSTVWPRPQKHTALLTGRSVGNRWVGVVM